MSDYISDIEAISNRLNITKFHLFGHSWGGLYAQIYAEEYPEKLKVCFCAVRVQEQTNCGKRQKKK